MGRPKSYDRAEALHQMTLVFWRKGYQATTLSDLERATGVNRKSLITEFGGKEAIFAEALGHYLQFKAAPDGEPLRRQPLGPDNIRAFFRAIRYTDEELGCLLALTILETDSVPPSAAELARQVYRQIESAFVDNLQPSIADGRLNEHEAERLATFLVNTLWGIIVAGRAQRSNDELAAVVEVALSVLPE